MKATAGALFGAVLLAHAQNNATSSSSGVGAAPIIAGGLAAMLLSLFDFGALGPVAALDERPQTAFA